MAYRLGPLHSTRRFRCHRFYTGNTTTGIIMLLTLGGCGIWVLIDIIMIACNTYVDGNGQTLK